MKNNIYYLIIGLLFVASACDDDKDKADYDFRGNGVPTGVTAATVNAVSMVSAEFSASVEGNNGCTIVENGFVVSKSEHPTITDMVVAASTNNTGAYSAKITGLTPGTTYYVRAYSLNCEGAAYSKDESSFTTNPHPLAAFAGAKTMTTVNDVAEEYETLQLNIDLDPDDLSVLYINGLQSAQAPLALGTMKAYVDLDANEVRIPAGQQVEEKKYGAYQYVLLKIIDRKPTPFIEEDIIGYIEDGKIHIDDIFGALIVVGNNEGLFHTVYKNSVIE